LQFYELVYYVTQLCVYKKIVVILNTHESLHQDNGQNGYVTNSSLQNQTCAVLIVKLKLAIKEIAPFTI